MKIKKVIPYLLVFLASFLITPYIITSFIKKAHNKAQEYSQNFSPNTAKLKDGTYNGCFRYFIFTFSKVEFEVKDGKIKNIAFKKMFHSPGSPYKKDIEAQIKRTKLLEVNAISGATRTSNFAKAALKNAIVKNSK